MRWRDEMREHNSTWAGREGEFMKTEGGREGGRMRGGGMALEGREGGRWTERLIVPIVSFDLQFVLVLYVFFKFSDFLLREEGEESEGEMEGGRRLQKYPHMLSTSSSCPPSLPLSPLPSPSLPPSSLLPPLPHPQLPHCLLLGLQEFSQTSFLLPDYGCQLCHHLSVAEQRPSTSPCTPA